MIRWRDRPSGSALRLYLTRSGEAVAACSEQEIPAMFKAGLTEIAAIKVAVAHASVS